MTVDPRYIELIAAIAADDTAGAQQIVSELTSEKMGLQLSASSTFTKEANSTTKASDTAAASED